MLRQNNLDDERFEQLARRARMSVSNYLPVWNDLNTHDPGVMLIEMMAWLTEIQRFHMDQSERASAFFPLLGIATRRAQPASVPLYFMGPAGSIPAGTPIMAQGVRFELEEAYEGGGAQLTAVQRETLCEDINCGKDAKHICPGRYLAGAGDVMLFCVLDDRYVRVKNYEVNVHPKSGFVSFEALGDFPESAHFHVVSCAHGALHSRVLGVADSFPGRSFTVDTRGCRLIYGSFSLLIGDNYDFSTARRWELVENFAASSPSDLHFTLDEETGRVEFGDGIRGALPNGVVMMASAALTLGEGGNIAAGRISEIEFAGISYPLSQPQHAKGGEGRENTAQTLTRWQTQARRAVTAQDIEELVLETPELRLELAKAFPAAQPQLPHMPRRVIVAAKPQGGQTRLSEEEVGKIRAHLEPYRLAGFEYEVRSPQYVIVSIDAQLRVLPHGDRLEGRIESGVRSFFTERFGVFGAHIVLAALSEYLFGFPGIAEVSSLDMRATGRGATTDSKGDIILAPGALAVLENVKVRLVC